MNEFPIELKNVKLTKMGSRRIVHIPNEYLKNGQIDPDLEYDIILNPKKTISVI